ncbi:hypothetical protein [Catenuloplanes japonicus]|uniref:hypothetical protein n=1 Tax=Catenuloplanes japonicus TaxID=33876 RepID=UPI00068BD645|nr:hypothetical protein [Catenuloplanes japonicus]
MDGFIQQANLDEILQLSRTATLSWLAFFAFAMLALAGLSLLNRDREAVAELREYRRHRRRYRRRLRVARATAARVGTTTGAVISKPLPSERHEPTLDEMRRYAAEVATAAMHAEQTAARSRTEWEAAERIQQSAWRALQIATDAAERLNRASAFASSVEQIEESTTELDRSELEERRAHLRRAATRAFHRGEIRYDQLSVVLTFEGEWSPRVSPLEHERSLLRLAQERLNAAYQEATRIERRAWDLAATASAAKTSLAQEAGEAELTVTLAEAEAAAPTGVAAVLAKVGAVRLSRRTKPAPVRRVTRVVLPEPAAVALPAEDIEATTDLTALTAKAEAAEAVAVTEVVAVTEDIEATVAIPAVPSAADAADEWQIEASAVVAAAQAEIEAAASRTEDASPEDSAALNPAALPVMGIARVPLRAIPSPRATDDAEAPTVSARAAVTAPGAVVAGRASVKPRVVAVVGKKDGKPTPENDDDDPTSTTIPVMASR